MKNILFFILFSFLLVACGTSKRSISNVSNNSSSEYNKTTNKKNRGKEAVSEYAKKVTKNAIKYKGTPYQYGGTTKRGMDCSGLIYVSFQKEGIKIPRTSRAMSLEGKRLKLGEVRAGDLLFFQTNKNRNVINHVALVVKVSGSEISFIHSTTSLGVIISTLDQPYWNDAFMMARRLL